MKDMELGINLCVTCCDGTQHEGVTLRIENDCRVFETPEGQRLDVVLINSGTIAASPMEYAMICHHCKHKEG